jgi:Domain of unknown function (DUF4157)
MMQTATPARAGLQPALKTAPPAPRRDTALRRTAADQAWIPAGHLPIERDHGRGQVIAPADASRIPVHSGQRQAHPVPSRLAAGPRSTLSRSVVPIFWPGHGGVRADPARRGLSAPSRVLLRECNCGQYPGAASCDQCEERQLQRSRDRLKPSHIPTDGRVHPRIASAIEAARGAGQPLERSIRERLELQLGEALGDVRVHADARAEVLTRAVSARAFTVGSDMFFGPGAYQPGSREGNRLIAHEVTHTVQQRGAPATGALRVSVPGDGLELEAETAAAAFQAEVGTRPRPLISRGHEPTDSTGAKRTSRNAPVSLARTVDPTSEAYLRGYNDGRAGSSAAPGPLSPDALDDYNEGYQNGVVEAENARASLPSVLAGPGHSAAPSETPVPASPAETRQECDVRLCFVPLEALTDRKVPAKEAYAIAVHAFIEWNGESAGFTRVAGDKIANAQVYRPEPRAGDKDKVCVKATPTSGHNCPADCDSVYARIHSLTTPGLMKGQYSLLSNNCETFARDTLRAACMTAPSAPSGGVGNDIVDEYQDSLAGAAQKWLVKHGYTFRGL